MLAYSYLRFSSPEQMKGDSFRRQLEASEKYAADNKLELDTTLKLHDLGLSAFDKTNVIKGQLGGFLRAVESGAVQAGSYLLVESLDRLSRAQVLDALQQFISILNSGIIIVTLSDNQKYSKESVGDNFSQLLISITIMQRAHEESMTKSKRIGAAWQRAITDTVENGKRLKCKLPYWMKVVNDKIELIPERAEVVRLICKMSRDGIGQPTLLKMLNSDYPAWNKKGVWSSSYVCKILNNTALYGDFEIGGTTITNYFPAVISKDEWLYLQSIRNERSSRNVGFTGSRKGASLSNLFSGFVFCGYCGSKMVMHSYVRRGDEQSYYNFLTCNGAKTGSTKCKCVQWKYKEIETMIIWELQSLDFNKLFGVKAGNETSKFEDEIIALSGRILENKRRIENIYKAIEEEPIPGLAKRIVKFEDENTLLEADKLRLSSAMAREKLAIASGDKRMKSLIKLFKSMNVEDENDRRIVREALQTQFKSIIEKIDLYPTGPTLNRQNRDMRYLEVHLKSGTVVEIS